MGKNVTFLAQVFGITQSHIDFDHFEVPVAKTCIEDLQKLKSASQKAGFNLCLASGYRSFDRQLLIWNEKMLGNRPVLDEHEAKLDTSQIGEYEKILAILKWSALPGASRHHWGTDVDIYDDSSLPENYSLQLTVKECNSLFKDFYAWLDTFLDSQENPFFRPYFQHQNDVSDEPWHLSHKHFSVAYEQAMNIDALRKLIKESDIVGKKTLLEHLDEIFERFVL